MKQPVPYVAARILIAAVFAGLGAERLLVAAGALTGRKPPGLAGLAFSGFELLAGLAIMIGWQAGRLALLLAVMLTVDAIVAHPFWLHEGVTQHDQLLHFLKNFSIVGGLLLLSWHESTTGAGQP
jgi:putative oxidoreductase